MDLSPVAGLGTALAIGLLLGLEREHATAGERFRPAGSRTFPLIALAGALGQALSPAVAAVGFAAVALVVLVWYREALRSERADVGATTEVTALTAYLLGAPAWEWPQLAAIAASWSRCCWRRNVPCTGSRPTWSPTVTSPTR